ncbi:MAG: phosphoribosylglycinamide formyltransferase [Bacteroidales bacterium]|jgi:phosphoribosylglycinamide formyltransferase-1|nr:phosphoribosylglycinamide formyltransferase [Bacteroidales bacterium]
MKKIAIFASGFGSNFQALIEAIEKDKLHAAIVLLVSDKEGCYAIERAAQNNIDTFVFNAKNYPNKEAYEMAIATILKQKQVDLIVLAGYMRIIGKVLLDQFEGKIINIHPSLLPAFPGLHAIEQAYQYGVKIFGITIHYVEEDMDTGKIIAQDCFKISENEDIDTIEAQIHQLEHHLYPKVVEMLLKK